MSVERVIAINNVAVTYGYETGIRKLLALDDVSLDVYKGEFVSVIGPSGCGKSTLLNIVGGLLKANSGTVTVDGTVVEKPLPKITAMVFQEHSLFPWRTTIKNVEVGLEFQGIDKEERHRRALKYLDLVGLKDFVHHYPGELSGGMKQRVAIARALSLETEILLMDEPFGALDEQTRMVLGEELSKILAKTQKTIVFVTHSLSEAVFLSDRIAVMTSRPGKIKDIIKVEAPHPRNPEFMTSDEFNHLRNRLFDLLHEEIRKTVLSERVVGPDISSAGKGDTSHAIEI
ncbi:MAG: ABC transporter ATP-binding protein [Chloroflexi bacterium]|nr:ABC transporter ATP-binding protein [Chloroflexota bacterium]